MPSIPQLQFHQTYAKIGMQTKQGKMEIRQPKATVNMHQEPAKLELTRTNSKLQIDQTKAWGALGLVKFPEFPNRIYDNLDQVVLDSIAKIAQEGDRMAAIHMQSDPFAEMATDLSIEMPELDYLDPASYDNVDLYFEPGILSIQWIRGGVDIQVQQNKPEINYSRAKVDIYLAQKNSLEIMLPKIEQRI